MSADNLKFKDTPHTMDDLNARRIAQGKPALEEWRVQAYEAHRAAGGAKAQRVKDAAYRAGTVGVKTGEGYGFGDETATAKVKPNAAR